MKSQLRIPEHGVFLLVLQFLLAVIFLGSFIPGSVRAQGTQPQRLTATNDEMLCGFTDQALRRYIKIYDVGAAGGQAFSQAVFGYQAFNQDLATGICTPSAYTELVGSFTGGPNGTLTFPTPNDVYVTTCQVLDGKSIQCDFVMESLDSTWSKVFTFEDPAAFSASAAPAQITSEYIYKTYGIRVEDSFGEDGYAQAAWSDHELSLLNDVLKEIPPAMLKNMALTSIIRNKLDMDENGSLHAGGGKYFPCGKYNGKDCSGASSVIRIFDGAVSPNSDFSNDPNGDIEFKATILHEMIHAYQYRKDENSIYMDVYNSPLVLNYMDATRPNTASESGPTSGWNHNGWAWYGQPAGWKLYSTNDNLPPTDYGKTNPIEDMSEAVMMYVNDPLNLRAVSMARYNFIRDQIFGGVEYENGIQKQP